MMTELDTAGSLIGLRRPMADDRDELIALSEVSVTFLHPWIDPPRTTERFDTYLGRVNSGADYPSLICEIATGRIVGVINISCIIRGLFQSAFLGYWIGAPYARRGYMTEAMQLALGDAFGKLGLHRLEANIQPGNTASIALAKRSGFTKEGFSPQYLQVFGEWRDHERWAIRADGRVKE